MKIRMNMKLDIRVKMNMKLDIRVRMNVRTNMGKGFWHVSKHRNKDKPRAFKSIRVASG